jgi:hypothetical protein
MSETIANCLACGKPFRQVRAAMKSCSRACKQKAYRDGDLLGATREKCNAVGSGISKSAKGADQGETHGFVRVWGPNSFSEIELRVLGLEPTGKRSGAAMLYRRVAA